jgi:hypothetical protein
MIKVKFLRNTVAEKVCVKIGQVRTLSDSEARLLIGLGKAEQVIEEEKEEAAPVAQPAPSPEVNEPESEPAAVQSAPKSRKKKKGDQ